MSEIPPPVSTPGLASHDSPNWSVIDREILCPLCDYNLRGLVEPRCPECGYQFTWKELLDRQNWEHPWLFEHNARRRSFWKTFFVSQLPRKFWASVQPTHPPRFWRLMRFWLYALLLFVIPGVVGQVIPIAKWYYDIYRYRQQLAAQIALPSPPFSGTYVPYAEYARFTYPYPWTLWQSWGEFPVGTHLAGHLALAGLAWPWMTLLTLVLLLTWIGLILCESPLNGPSGYSSRKTIYFDWTALLVCLVAAGIMAWRMTLACAIYLRLPHAAATCIAVQVIVLLAMLSLSNWSFIF